MSPAASRTNRAHTNLHCEAGGSSPEASHQANPIRTTIGRWRSTNTVRPLMRTLATAWATAPAPAYTTAAAAAATPRMSAMAVPRCISGQGAGPCPPFKVLDLDTEGIRVARKPLAQKMWVEAEFSQLVIPPRSAAMTCRAQPAAHAPLRFLGQRETAMPIDRSDGIEWARDNLTIVKVQDRVVTR